MTPGAMCQALTPIKVKLAYKGDQAAAEVIDHVQAFLIEFERNETSWITTGQNVLEWVRAAKISIENLQLENDRLRAELAWAISK